MMPMTTAEGHYGKMVTTELLGICFLEVFGLRDSFSGVMQMKTVLSWCS